VGIKAKTTFKLILKTKGIRMNYKTAALNHLSHLKYFFLLTLSFAFLSTGCQLDSTNNNADSAQADHGTLEISFISPQSRTLQPVVDLVADSYRVIGTGPDGKSLDQTVAEGNSIQLDSMETGEWNLIVEAFNADNYLFSRGSVDVTIEAGVLAQETVLLSILQNTGSFSLSIEVPDSMSDAPYVIGTLQTDLQADIPLSFTTQAGSEGYTLHTALLNNSVPAGYYTLSVTVFDDENMHNDPSRYTGFADSVRILEGLTTAGTFTLNDAPGIETTLNIEFELNDVIDVTLLDAATLPTGFDFNSVTQYLLIPSIPIEDIDAASMTYEWFVNGQSVSTDFQYEINSLGRIATGTTTRTTEAPTLEFNEFIIGTPAILTSTITAFDTVVGNFASVANGGQDAEITFDIEITDINDVTNVINIQLNETTLNNWGVPNVSAVTIDDLNFIIEQQINTSPFGFLLNINAPAPMSLFDNSGPNSGSINFVPVSNNIYDLSSLGFATNNRSGDAIADLEANNRFALDIAGFGFFDIWIAPATYASVSDLAAAIQTDVEAHVGTEILAVSAVNDRLVFTNKQLGSAFFVNIFPSGVIPPVFAEAVLDNLKFNNLNVTLGIDENPSEPRYLPGQYTVDVIAKNASGTRGGSTRYNFEVIAN